MDDLAIKTEPGSRDNGRHDAHDARPSYKSYKKKYRKMRLGFDEAISRSEELHRLEQKAIRTAKRLAIENDRLLDLLMDINNSPQIPFERRIDINLDETKQTQTESAQRPTKSLKVLLEEVPHTNFAVTTEHRPSVLEDLQPKDAEMYPTSFLNAEEIDNYLAEIDVRIGQRPKPSVPPSKAATMAANSVAANYALRNPTSVYNWLRKNAPKTFLQDMEKDSKEKDHDHGDKAEGSSKRKSTSGRGSTKRQSNASRREAGDSMDWDEDANDANHAGSLRGKRKRDEDPGYRPKGGASRPTKKRKSTDSRTRKSIAA